MTTLSLPKNKRYTQAKLAAYKRHWRGVRSIQDEFSRQYIPQALSIKEISEESQISRPTVSRFFHFGKGNGKMGYSYFHGPSITTIFGIADALSLEVIVKPKKNGHLK